MTAENSELCRQRSRVGVVCRHCDRSFHDHNVDKESRHWIYRLAVSEADARDTERYLLERYGFQGGTGGGDNPRFVYAYKITAATRQ